MANPRASEGVPIVHFHFSNGWTASVRLSHPGYSGLACWPTNRKASQKPELGEQEASDDEVAAYLYHVSSRSNPDVFKPALPTHGNGRSQADRPPSIAETLSALVLTADHLVKTTGISAERAADEACSAEPALAPIVGAVIGAVPPDWHRSDMLLWAKRTLDGFYGARRDARTVGEVRK